MGSVLTSTRASTRCPVAGTISARPSLPASVRERRQAPSAPRRSTPSCAGVGATAQTGGEPTIGPSPNANCNCSNSVAWTSLAYSTACPLASAIAAIAAPPHRQRRHRHLADPSGALGRTGRARSACSRCWSTTDPTPGPGPAWPPPRCTIGRSPSRRAHDTCPLQHQTDSGPATHQFPARYGPTAHTADHTVTGARSGDIRGPARDYFGSGGRCTPVQPAGCDRWAATHAWGARHPHGGRRPWPPDPTDPSRS